MLSRHFMVCFLLVLVTALASAQVQVFTSQAAFLAATKSEAIPFPVNADSALTDKPWGASLQDYSCTSNALGFLLPLGSPDPQVRVTAPDASEWICFIGKNWNAGPANISPQPQSPTIVANGLDNYLLHFHPVVQAVGVELLTNAAAMETMKLVFADGTQAVYPKAALGTLPNRFEFVGFKSIKPIREVVILTEGGAVQNEGVTAIHSSACYLVAIDVKPGSYPNSINLGSKGKIAVAVLSTPYFDATKVDLASIEIGGGGVVVRNNGTWQAGFEYVNGDMLLDLVVHVETQDLTLPPSATFVSLNGMTMGGTRICGADSVRIVPAKK